MTGYGQSSLRLLRKMICMELLLPSQKLKTSRGKRRDRGKQPARVFRNPASSEMSQETGGCQSWTLTGKSTHRMCLLTFRLPQDRTEMLNHVKSWVFAEKAQVTPTSSASTKSTTAPQPTSATSTTSATSAGSRGPPSPRKFFNSSR
jgi:hypothetical protein